jgi:hypothetical protein
MPWVTRFFTTSSHWCISIAHDTSININVHISISPKWCSFMIFFCLHNLFAMARKLESRLLINNTHFFLKKVSCFVLILFAPFFQISIYWINFFPPHVMHNESMINEIINVSWLFWKNYRGSKFGKIFNTLLFHFHFHFSFCKYIHKFYCLVLHALHPFGNILDVFICLIWTNESTWKV